MKRQRRLWCLLFLCACIAACTACGSKEPTVTDGRDVYLPASQAQKIEDKKQAKQEKNQKKDYDSEEFVVIKEINPAAEFITLQSAQSGYDYRLSYSGATDFRDKYDQVISVAELSPAMIANACFDSGSEKLISLKISEQGWVYTDVANFRINQQDRTFEIGSDSYRYSENLIVESEGLIKDIMEINPVDVLTVRGSEKVVYGISVEKGHGYVRLKNEDYFVGGWVDIGQVLAKPVSKDMLLTAPEGEYKLTIANEGGGGTKNITIRRNEEIVVDVADLRGETVKKGSIDFTITPSTAKLYLNGKLYDERELVVLDYGKYEVEVKAEGYEPYLEEIEVKQSFVKKEITLKSTEAEEASGSSVASNTANNTNNTNSTGGTSNNTTGTSGTNTGTNTENTGNDNSSSNTGNESDTNDAENEEDTNDEDETQEDEKKYQIYLEAPKNVQVFFNGSYMGRIPLNFDKVAAGTHTVTLRRTGYENKSYTIQVDENDADMHFSFPELTKEKDGEK